MPFDNVIKIPIQINGGIGSPSLLKQRELYVSFDTVDDTPSLGGYLYYGNEEGQVRKISAGYADTAKTAQYVNTKGFNFNGTTGDLGNIKISVNGDITTLTGSSTEKTILKTMQLHSMLLNNPKINNVQSMSISDSMWGTTLPTSGMVKGSIFFKI